MYAPKKQEPGMDDDLAQRDREAITIEARFTTGNNPVENPMMSGGLEVGEHYGDFLGEEYSNVTFVDSPNMPSGAKAGGAQPNDFGEVKSSGGGMKASTPQNYSKS